MALILLLHKILQQSIIRYR